MHAVDSPRIPEGFYQKNLPFSTNLTQVFSEWNRSYVNEFALFVSYFNHIPQLVQIDGISCTKAIKWFVENYGSNIGETFIKRKYGKESKAPVIWDAYYILTTELIVYFDTDDSSIRLLYRETAISETEKLITGFQRFRKRKTKLKPEIFLLVHGERGIETKSFEISKPKLNIYQNYNDDFMEIHGIIQKKLSAKNGKGLVLLHGKPGTGKTSYIRYLICSLRKNVIFLPPNMASALTNPHLISVLIDNPNSVLVIEDSENIVVAREQDKDSPVTAILNICDGLLADFLNIQIICSFNTDISKIDSALLRKGRLIAKYEFKELEVKKAQVLSKRLGFNTEIYSPLPLASIYNQDENDFQPLKKSSLIGFRRNHY